MKFRFCAAAALVAPIAFAQPALAAPGDPVKVSPELTIDPIIDARLRYESVDTPTLDADAVTLRIRAGAELKHKSGLSLLVEGEGTLGIVSEYNAFPFVITDSQRRPGFAAVPDPMNVELNRLQLQYKGKAATITVGRQRINLDDQRWVGAVGWRQNEQTYDAARAELKFGKVSFDATYAIDQRTIWGVDGGPRAAFGGNFVFLGAGSKLGPVQVKAFAYMLDYDTAEQVGALATVMADTQTYGLRAAASFKLSPKVTLGLTASYARQSDWQDNPLDYAVDYIAAEGSLSFGNFGVLAGYEGLGGNGTRALQTPMATLHKFNGWADLFLTTPVNGLQDYYGGALIKFPKVKALPGLNAAVTYHRFESDLGGLHYGNEWDASLGFKLGRYTLLAKYADYDAAAFGADSRKIWLQVELAF
ncbi:alginate export family protein [Novosphingobium sp.]|uniref:alginate export family protein n=1 Tax=Novosphingobium sp. TaxID=1874826 RepID=UPI0025DAD404|nr:alginate export family protein [Novosphingobium sp.]